jgi:biotin carboxyl carrier protein
MAVFVKVGDKVQAGQPLFKMEAMKMENEINSFLDGTVSGINVNAGDNVNQGQELMSITPAEHLKNRRKTDA